MPRSRQDLDNSVSCYLNSVSKLMLCKLGTHAKYSELQPHFLGQGGYAHTWWVERRAGSSDCTEHFSHSGPRQVRSQPMKSSTEPLKAQLSLSALWEWLLVHTNMTLLMVLSEELAHWKRPQCWERLRAGGEGDDRGWDGWMASPTQWTSVCVDSGSWWWTGRPGVLQFMGSQRVGHDWATELNWTEWSSFSFMLCLGLRGLLQGSLWFQQSRYITHF